MKELNNDEKSLLEISAKELIPMLSEKKKLTHVKQVAFEYYSEQTDEIFQVQVLVTRDESDFLEPFTTEEMSNYVDFGMMKTILPKTNK